VVTLVAVVAVIRAAIEAVVGEGKEKTGNGYCDLRVESQKCRARRNVRCLVTTSKHINNTRATESPASKYVNT
jgi:hypothetical protein